MRAAKGQPNARSFDFWIWIVAGVTAGLAVFYAWFVAGLGLTKILVDADSHLNIARQVVDSMTPGVSQLGFWPPLLHIVLLPFVSVTRLYQSGLAGPFAVIPFLILGSIFFYKLLKRITQNSPVSAAGALLFVLNPYLLYYSATPMMETLFISLTVIAAYALVRWMQTESLGSLIATGAMLALASLTRFEGLILIPAAVAAVIMHLIKKRRGRTEIEAILILLIAVAIVGGVTIMAYSWFFGNDPFAFMNSDWSAFSQQRDYELPAAGHPLTALTYLLHASYYMLGKPEVLIAFLAWALLLIFFPRPDVIAASFMLFAPFLFDWFALIRGNILIYVDELPPYHWFYNERYGLYWIGFTAFTPVVLAGLLLKTAPLRWRSLSAMISGSAVTVSSLILVSLLGLNLGYLAEVSFEEQFAVVRESARRYPAQTQLEVVEALRDHYDFGKILITRASHDFVTVNAGIPLRDYILESNFRYYDQALERPWLFARFVVMYNNSNNENILIPNWSKKNEKVSLRWGSSRLFPRYYDLVLENRFERLYKLNDAAVRDYAISHGLEIAAIPSLNPEGKKWDPERIYLAMNGEAIEHLADAEPGEALASTQSVSGKTAGESRERPLAHTVLPGETLWIIAQKYYGDGARWPEIARENRIRNPAKVKPGDILILKGALPRAEQT